MPADRSIGTLKKHAAGMFLTPIAAAMPPQHPASIRRTILRQPLRRGVKKTCQWHVFSRDLGSYAAVAATSPYTGEALGCVRTPHPYGEWSETICRGRRLCRPDRTIPRQPLRRFAPPPFAQTGGALDYHMAKALAFTVRAGSVVRPYEFLRYLLRLPVRAVGDADPYGGLTYPCAHRAGGAEPLSCNKKSRPWAAFFTGCG